MANVAPGFLVPTIFSLPNRLCVCIHPEKRPKKIAPSLHFFFVPWGEEMKAGIARIKQARQQASQDKDKAISDVCDGMSLCLESNEAKEKISRVTNSKFQQLQLPLNQLKHPNFISAEEASILSLLGARPDWQSSWTIVARYSQQELSSRAWKCFHRFMYLSTNDEFVHSEVHVDAYYHSSLLTWTDPAKIGRYSLDTMRIYRSHFLRESETVQAWTEALTTIEISDCTNKKKKKLGSDGYGRTKTATTTITCFLPELVKLMIAYLLVP